MWSNYQFWLTDYTILQVAKHFLKLFGLNFPGQWFKVQTHFPLTLVSQVSWIFFLNSCVVDWVHSCLLFHITKLNDNQAVVWLRHPVADMVIKITENIKVNIFFVGHLQGSNLAPWLPFKLRLICNILKKIRA